MKANQINSIHKLKQLQFLRIGRSQAMKQLGPNKIMSTVLSNQYIFFDFQDQKCVKILQKADPNDSEEELHSIGNKYISNLNNLSSGTYKMLHYLHEGKAADQNRNKIDIIVRDRVRRIRNSKILQQPLGKGKRKNLKNYSLRNQVNERQSINQNLIRFPENPNELEQYLERAHNKIVIEKLKDEEKKLQNSISSAGYYNKLIKRNHSLQIQPTKTNIQVKLPQIKSRSRNRSRNF